MPTLDEMICEYRAVVVEESKLAARKKVLRDAILSELSNRKRSCVQSPHGTATRGVRFALHARKDAVLNLLAAEDLFPFAKFTSKKVKLWLVPKFGREALLPLFDVERLPYLTIRSPR